MSGAALSTVGGSTKIKHTHAANGAAESDANILSDEERKILLKMKRLGPIRLIIMRFIDTDDKLNWPAIRLEVVKVIAELEKMNAAIAPGRISSVVSSQHIYTKTGLKICKDGLQLCKDLQKYDKQLAGHDDAQAQALLKRLEELIVEMNAMEINISDAVNSTPISSPGPNLAQEQQNQSQGGGMLKSAVENSRFKVKDVNPCFIPQLLHFRII